MMWFNEYVGRKYEKGTMDCWAICLIAFNEKLGIDIELYKGCKESGAELSYIISQEKTNPLFERILEPSENSLVCCVKNNVNVHVAFMLDDVNIIHSMDGYGVRIDNVNILRRIGYELEFYKLRGIG